MSPGSLVMGEQQKISPGTFSCSPAPPKHGSNMNIFQFTACCSVYRDYSTSAALKTELGAVICREMWVRLVGCTAENHSGW